MRDDIFRQLAKKYINNECSPQEASIVFELIKEGRFDEILKEVIDDTPSVPAKEVPMQNIPALDGSLLRIKKEIGVYRKKDYTVISTIAAAFIGILVAAVFIFNQATKQSMMLASAAFGETKVVLLPDSTEVTLNANSKIRYPEHMKSGQREVWLSGEAYFKVTKRQGKKFVVHTNDLDVVVLGTQFNVNDRRKRTRVVLEKGKVRLNIQTIKTPIEMSPGDYVEYSGKSGELVQKLVKTERFTAWKENKLFFDYTPLWQVAQTMRDLYGIQIKFKNKSDKYNLFTGNYDLHEPYVVIDALQAAFGFKAMRKENLVFLE